VLKTPQLAALKLDSTSIKRLIKHGVIEKSRPDITSLTEDTRTEAEKEDYKDTQDAVRIASNKRKAREVLYTPSAPEEDKIKAAKKLNGIYERIGRRPTGRDAKLLKPYEDMLKPKVSSVAEQSGSKFMPVIDRAIEAVPKVNIPGYSDEQNNFIHSQHKELLNYARNENESKEVAFIFSGDFVTKVIQKGESETLEFISHEAVQLLVGKKDLFIMHNHPGGGSFSSSDIVFLLEHDSIKIISIVKNNGAVLV
jgi:hypothetical protein